MSMLVFNGTNKRRLCRPEFELRHPTREPDRGPLRAGQLVYTGVKVDGAMPF